MTPKPATAVFVSYSHADAPLVAPVVKLLRVNQAIVFQDVDGIAPGKRWRDAIDRAIADARLVVVFWCDHAKRSAEVAREWQAAITQDKDLLPLLLDDTPLPPQLQAFQWIDFRGTVGASHASAQTPAPITAPEKSARRWPAIGLGAALAALAGAGLTTTLLMSPRQPDAPSLPPPPGGSALVTGILLLAGLTLASMAVLAWRRRRCRAGRAIPRTAEPTEGSMERKIAATLEKEILRRTVSPQAGR